MDKEQYYDEQIAPVLMELAKKCDENGLSLIAECEWVPGMGGTTGCIQKDVSFAFRLIKAAVDSRGNVDSLITALLKHARKHGHSSIYLKQLGISPQPEDVKDHA